MVVKEYYEVVIFRKVRCYTSDCNKNVQTDMTLTHVELILANHI